MSMPPPPGPGFGNNNQFSAAPRRLAPAGFDDDGDGANNPFSTSTRQTSSSLSRLPPPAFGNSTSFSSSGMPPMPLMPGMPNNFAGGPPKVFTPAEPPKTLGSGASNRLPSSTPENQATPAPTKKHPPMPQGENRPVLLQTSFRPLPPPTQPAPMPAIPPAMLNLQSPGFIRASNHARRPARSAELETDSSTQPAASPNSNESSVPAESKLPAVKDEDMESESEENINNDDTSSESSSDGLTTGLTTCEEDTSEEETSSGSDSSSSSAAASVSNSLSNTPVTKKKPAFKFDQGDLKSKLSLSFVPSPSSATKAPEKYHSSNQTLTLAQNSQLRQSVSREAEGGSEENNTRTKPDIAPTQQSQNSAQLPSPQPQLQQQLKQPQPQQQQNQQAQLPPPQQQQPQNPTQPQPQLPQNDSPVLAMPAPHPRPDLPRLQNPQPPTSRPQTEKAQNILNNGHETSEGGKGQSEHREPQNGVVAAREASPNFIPAPFSGALDPAASSADLLQFIQKQKFLTRELTQGLQSRIQAKDAKLEALQQELKQMEAKSSSQTEQFNGLMDKQQHLLQEVERLGKARMGGSSGAEEIARLEEEVRRSSSLVAHEAKSAAVAREALNRALANSQSLQKALDNTRKQKAAGSSNRPSSERIRSGFCSCRFLLLVLGFSFLNLLLLTGLSPEIDPLGVDGGHGNAGGYGAVGGGASPLGQWLGRDYRWMAGTMEDFAPSRWTSMKYLRSSLCPSQSVGQQHESVGQQHVCEQQATDVDHLRSELAACQSREADLQQASNCPASPVCPPQADCPACVCDASQPEGERCSAIAGEAAAANAAADKACREDIQPLQQRAIAAEESLGMCTMALDRERTAARLQTTRREGNNSSVLSWEMPRSVCVTGLEKVVDTFEKISVIDRGARQAYKDRLQQSEKQLQVMQEQVAELKSSVVHNDCTSWIDQEKACQENLLQKDKEIELKKAANSRLSSRLHGSTAEASECPQCPESTCDEYPSSPSFPLDGSVAGPAGSGLAQVWEIMQREGTSFEVLWTVLNSYILQLPRTVRAVLACVAAAVDVTLFQLCLPPMRILRGLSVVFWVAVAVLAVVTRQGMFGIVLTSCNALLGIFFLFKPSSALRCRCEKGFTTIT